MQNLDGSTHRANHAASNDPLRQLKMMKSKKVYAFVEIQQAFRYVVQAKEFIMPSVKVIHAEIRLA
jgi:hypothetical protein